MNLPNLNDPNIDPIKLLEEFKEWGLNNRKKMRCHSEPEGKWAFGDEPSKIESLINTWLNEKFKSCLEWTLEDFKQTLDERRQEVKNRKELAVQLIELWKLHHEVQDE